MKRNEEERNEEERILKLRERSRRSLGVACSVTCTHNCSPSVLMYPSGMCMHQDLLTWFTTALICPTSIT